MNRNRITTRLAMTAALVICAGNLGGCLMEAAPGSAAVQTAPAESDPNVGAKTAGDQTAPADGVPPGCTREWNATVMDSLVYCPDIRPPKPG